MRDRKFIMAVAALALVVGLGAVFWPEKEMPEPVYEGKKLGQWLDEAAAQQAFTMEIREALQAIGTNGIPCYLHWINHEPSLRKKIGNYITIRTKGWPNVGSTPGTAKEIRAFYAYHALGDLGERGAPAIPQFLAYATRPPPTLPSSAVKSPTFAIRALGMMGRPGMAAYLSLVTNDDARVRTLAVGQSRGFSRSFYQFPEVAAEVKRRSLEDPDYQVRVAATNALTTYTPIVAKPTTP